MANYTFAEQHDMMFMYGAAWGNAREAARLYQEHFPNRNHPSHKAFSVVSRRLREEGTFVVNRHNCGATRTRRTVDFEEEVLERVAENPSTSSRAIAHEMGVNHVSVWEVLHEQQLHPYHPQKVQAMVQADFPRRVEFCQEFLRRCNEDPEFQVNVLFSDEASFTKEGIFNSRNSHIWDDENPHAVVQKGYQQRFSVNIWAGIVGDRLIGPYLLPQRLTGAIYLNFLRHVLPELLEDVPPQMWLQHDGAPAHFSAEVREFLNNTFPNRWIGRGGHVAWPPRSPDLTPLDFFLWGHVKTLVYATPVETVEELTARILAACEEVQQTPGIFGAVRRNLLRRCASCVEAGGRHFEHLL